MGAVGGSDASLVSLDMRKGGGIKFTIVNGISEWV